MGMEVYGNIIRFIARRARVPFDTGLVLNVKGEGNDRRRGDADDAPPSCGNDATMWQGYNIRSVCASHNETPPILTQVQHHARAGAASASVYVHRSKSLEQVQHRVSSVVQRSMKRPRCGKRFLASAVLGLAPRRVRPWLLPGGVLLLPSGGRRLPFCWRVLPRLCGVRSLVLVLRLPRLLLPGWLSAS